MTTRYLATVLLVVGVAYIEIGCVPTMTIDQMKEMKIERPPELDLLSMFSGKWESTGRARGALQEVRNTAARIGLTGSAVPRH